jgi:hypothetical protein
MAAKVFVAKTMNAARRMLAQGIPREQIVVVLSEPQPNAQGNDDLLLSWPPILVSEYIKRQQGEEEA